MGHNWYIGEKWLTLHVFAYVRARIGLYNFVKKFSVIAVLLLLAACSGQVPELPSISEGPVEVGFMAGGGYGVSVKTAAGGDGLSTEWQAGDEVALWAVADGGGAILDAFPFHLYGTTDDAAFFSATIPQAMPEGEYTYYVTYPVPQQHTGLSASFEVPQVQDGRSGAGEDVMIGGPVRHGALGPVDWLAVDHSEMVMTMDHLLHRLRFYTTDSRFEGEPVQRIVATFPKAVVGGIDVDLAEHTLSARDGGSAILTVEAAEPAAISGTSARSYLTASIIPVSFDEGGSMQVKLYTETKVARAEIPLKSRTFAAGHSTPVRIIPDAVSNRGKIYVNILSNNLGENVDKVTMTAPEGCKWTDTGSNVYVYEPARPIADTRSFVLEYEDESAFRTMSGKAVTVTYDSEHVTISEDLAIEDLAGKYSTVLNLNVPYLLYEDFSGVTTFSSNDEYNTSSAGSKSPISFLDGWSGGRVGAEAGKCIRLACRRETSVDYDSRVDSAPLRGTFKKAADISVEFDYGANSRYGGIPISILDGNVGQDCYIGYVTGTTKYESGDTDGTFDRSVNTVYIKEYTGSYTNLPNNDSYTIREVPAGKTVRISWRTEVEHQAGTTNTTAWLYIDNVKVKISSK